jgi:hypothetical protein
MRGCKLRNSVNWQGALKQKCIKQTGVNQGLGVVWKDVIQNLVGRFFTVFMHFLQEICRIIPSSRGHLTLPIFGISAILSCNSINNMEDSIEV